MSDLSFNNKNENITEFNKENNHEKLTTPPQCFICHKILNNAIMCPKCNKLFCEKCIESFFSKNQENKCPNCKFSFTNNINSFKNFNSFNQLNNLSNKISFNFNNNENICKEHNLSLLYYCTECKNVLCSDCYMLNNKHKSHNIIKYEIIKKQLNSKKKDLILNLNKKSDEYLNMIESIININDSIDYYIEAKAKEIKKIYEDMLLKIHIKSNDIKNKLNICKEDIKTKVRNIDNLKTEIKNFNNLDDLEEFKIKNKNKIFKENIDDSIFNSIIKLDISKEISQEILPQYNLVNFKYNIEKNNNFLKKYCLLKNCYFKINIQNNKDIINFYIIKYNNVDLNKKLNVYFEIVNKFDIKKNYIFENEIFFDSENNICELEHFLNYNFLQKEGFIDKKGFIEIKFGIKAQNYKDLYNILNQFTNLDYNNNNNELNYLFPTLKKSKTHIFSNNKIFSLLNNNNNNINIKKISNINENLQLNINNKNNFNNEKFISKTIETSKKSHTYFNTPINNDKKIQNFSNNKNPNKNNQELKKSNSIIIKDDELNLDISEIPKEDQYSFTENNITLNDDFNNNSLNKKKLMYELGYLANDNNNLLKNNYNTNVLNNKYSTRNNSSNIYPKNSLIGLNMLSNNNKFSQIDILDMNLNAKNTVYPQNTFNFNKKK